MDRRNDPAPAPPPGAPGMPPGSPWGAAGETPPSPAAVGPRDPWNGAWRRRAPPPFGTPSPEAPAGSGGGGVVPLSTPLVWAGGGLLLTVTFWLASVIA